MGVTRKFLLVATAVCGLGYGLNQASAATLTPTAITLGFSLSIFSSGYINNGIGPVGLTVFSSNGVMVGDYNTGFINVYTDVDGQTYSNAGFNYGGGMAGLTTLNGNI